MTQKDKELLLKDLCARLPYSVIVHRTYIWAGELKEDDILLEIDDLDVCLNNSVEKLNSQGCTLKPYLRPISSMTEEEKEELSHLLPKYWSVEIDKLNNFYFDMSPSILMEIDMFLSIIDWLNAHHFDYRGLIEKGLALEALEGMYETL